MTGAAPGGRRVGPRRSTGVGERQRRLLAGLVLVGVTGCGEDYSRWLLSVTLPSTSAAADGAARAALDACAGDIRLRPNKTYPRALELVAEDRKDAEAFARCAGRLTGVRVSEVVAVDVDPGNRPA